MAPYFVFPRNLQDLEEESTEDNRLCVQNSVNVASLPSSQLEEFVKGNSKQTKFSLSPYLISHQFPFHSVIFYFLLKQVYPSISPTEKSCVWKIKMCSTVSTRWFVITLFSITLVNLTSLRVSVPISPCFSLTSIPFPGFQTTMMMKFPLSTVLLLIVTLLKYTPSSSSTLFLLKNPMPLLRYVVPKYEQFQMEIWNLKS